jgi:type IV pilus assembly protein PilX
MTMLIKNATIACRKRQHGAALVVGLLLLVVITVLAISGMNTATTELAMARNDQAYENAFQAAETGLANVLSQGTFSTNANSKLPTFNIDEYTSVNTTIQFEDSTMVPDAAFSLGVGSGIAAYHFLVISEADYKRKPGADTDRDSSALHTQAFYVVGPDSTTL